MNCTLPCAVCTPGSACFRCGWEEKEREFRQKKVQKGELTERLIIHEDKPMKVRGLALKGVKRNA